jgi:hypothetical protein
MMSLDEHVTRIEKDGFTIVEDAIEPSLVDRLVAAIDALHAELSAAPATNLFEGLATDYSSVLDNIAKGIVDRLGCELGYPGVGTTDPTKVVVRYTSSGAPAANLTQLTDVAKCAQVEDGWYYDDPTKPSKIVLCPSMCGTANASPGTKIEALVGCQAPAPR